MTNGSATFFEAVKARRTVYGLSDKSTLSDEQLRSLIETAVLHSPTSINMQNSRAILVLGDMHQKIWDMVVEEQTKLYPNDTSHIEALLAKVNGCFRTGYGTILFFDSHQILEEFGIKIPVYAKDFYVWSDNAAGMLQYIVWTALAQEGMGASLQHYGGTNPAVNDRLRKMFGLPKDWHSTAIMPFGVPLAPSAEKTFVPIEERVKVYKGTSE